MNVHVTEAETSNFSRQENLQEKSNIHNQIKFHIDAVRDSKKIDENR